VEELTLKQIAETLNVKTITARKRLERYGIQPVMFAGPTALYSPSALEAIRDVPGKGRPRKKPADK
jgi:hypothetical protein